MTRAWALWQAPGGAYEPSELLEIFTSEEVATAVRDNLFGKRRFRWSLNLTWEDDEDFPDLYVRPVDIR